MPVPHTLGQVGLVRKGEVLGTPNRKTQFGCELLDPLEPWSNGGSILMGPPEPLDLGSSCPRPAVTTVWKNVAIDMDLDATLIKGQVQV